MSQIYLTKIERKTIFTKSLIFVLVMFIISDLTVTGPFWFNFIPWMYVLGLLGSIKKIDNILMGIIGTFTVFISSIISNQSLNLDVVTDTAVALLLLVFGIVTGKFIYEFILEHRLVKYLRKSKKTIYIVLSILMLVVSFVLVGVTKGDLITYISSRTNLKEYIETNYAGKEYKIKNIIYNKEVNGKYVYVVDISGQDVNFVPVTDKVFKDANLEDRLEVLNNELNIKTKDKINEKIANSYGLLKSGEITLSYEYTKVDVIPDIKVMYITVTSEEETKDMLYEQLALFVNEINITEAIDKLVLTVDSNTVQITEINKIDKDYLLLALDIEELDNN